MSDAAPAPGRARLSAIDENQRVSAERSGSGAPHAA